MHRWDVGDVMPPEAAAWRRRNLAGTCPTCRAVPGQPCRTSFSTERHPKPPGWSNAESGVTGFARDPGWPVRSQVLKYVDRKLKKYMHPTYDEP